MVLPQGLPVRDSLTAAVAGGTDIRPAAIGSLPIRAMTERVSTPVGDVYIQVIQDRSAEQQTLDAILRVLLLGGALVVLVAVGVRSRLRTTRARPDPGVARPRSARRSAGSASSRPTRATSSGRR